MNAVAWIVLGGIVAFLALCVYIGWRLDQSAQSIAGIARLIQKTEDRKEDDRD